MIGWGRNDFGQTTVPLNLTNAIAISAGGQQSLALTKDGRVVQWGLTNGAIPSTTYYATLAIAAGTNFSLALLTNGNVVAWGDNSSSQTTIPMNVNGVSAVAVGGMHSLALRTNGVVIAWGSNGSGESTVPATLSTNIMSIAAGYAYSLALSNNGTIAAWGDNAHGQTSVPPLGNVKLLVAGGYQGVASVFSDLAQYPLDASKALLLLYNIYSTNSITVVNHYLQYRPMASRANLKGLASPGVTYSGGIDYETVTPADFTNLVLNPVLTWLSQNPTKRPQYVILFPDLPSRVSVLATNSANLPFYPPLHGPTSASVSYQLSTNIAGWAPFVTHINLSTTNDCIGYINKLATMGSKSVF